MSARPTTIVGLIAHWLRVQPRARGAVAVTAIAIAAVALTCSGETPSLEHHWRAGLHEHDFLQSLELDGDGTGRSAYGYAQQIRHEARFRYRVDGDAIELHDVVERGGARGALRVRYRVREGRWCFEAPYEPRRCYGCELELDGWPFPASYDAYYACPEP